MNQPGQLKNLEVTPDMSPEPPEPPPPLPTPIDILSLSLSVLAVVAVIFLLQFAQALLIPLVLGILISYALDPIVSWFGQWKIPRPLTAMLLLISLVGGLASYAYFLRDDAAAILDQLPTTVQQMRKRLTADRTTGPSAMEQVQQTAKELERVAAEAAGTKISPRTVAPSSPPLLDLSTYLWWGSVNAAVFTGQVVLVLFLVYFILASGDLYKRKLAKLAGPTLASKKITVEILDDINRQIERFLFVQLFAGVIAGVMTWAAFAWLGLDHPGVWGIAAGLANFIPYVGPLIIATFITVVGFLQFGTLAMAAFIAAISLAIKGFVGFLLTPWLMSKAAQMNPVAVFVGLLFWGWIWGVWGMLLAMPMIVVVKVVCDHVEDFKGIGELLGD